MLNECQKAAKAAWVPQRSLWGADTGEVISGVISVWLFGFVWFCLVWFCLFFGFC